MTEKIYKFALISFGLIAIAFFGAGSIANATVCGNALQGQIISAGYAGGQATASATNNSSDCTTQVTFSSYKMFVQPSSPGWLDTEVLFDSQTLTLAPGETKTFTVTNPNCKTQLDIYESPVQPHLSDAAGGFPGQNLLAWNINLNNVCGNSPPPPPPVTLACAPSSQTVNVGDIAAFSATGGTGSYTWGSPGTPSTGVGTNFSSAFSTSGQKIVTVASGSQTARCNVTVSQPVLTCTPSAQNGSVGANLNFSAVGGNGTYSWNTGNGNPASGSGATFGTSFATAGSKTITVTSGNETATCGATITQTVCNLPQTWLTVTTNISQNSATINAYLDPQGQSTTYYFEYGTVLGYGQTTIQQTITGAQNISATINGLQPDTVYYYRLRVQNTCGNQDPGGSFTTFINPQPPYTPPYYPPIYYPPYNPPYYPPYTPPYSQPYCNPQSQIVNVGSWVTFNASGGSGAYSWSAPFDAYPSMGDGYSFGTSFSTPGTRTVTVNANGGGSAQCTVSVIAQNSYASPPTGTVLGAADIVTGPEDAWPMSLALGLFASSLVYYFYFRPRLALKNTPLHIQVIDAAPVAQPKRKTELDKLLEQIKTGEQTPDA